MSCQTPVKYNIIAINNHNIDIPIGEYHPVEEHKEDNYLRLGGYCNTKN